MITLKVIKHNYNSNLTINIYTFIYISSVYIIILFMYFIMIRPQKKKEKDLKAQIDALKVGDKVVTIGGLCGKVSKLKDNYVFIETGNVGTPDERSIVKFEKSAIKLVETIHG